jgi:hypothetical protein
MLCISDIYIKFMNTVTTKSNAIQNKYCGMRVLDLTELDKFS